MRSPPPPRLLAETLVELERVRDDPQAVLSALVQLLDLLNLLSSSSPSSPSSSCSSSSSASLSLRSGSPTSLSHATTLVQTLLNQYTLPPHHNQEITTMLLRICSVWSRHCTRFQLECGRVRLWETLQSTRVAFPLSPRVREYSLDATAAILQGLEYHQQLQLEQRIVDELLALLLDADDGSGAESSAVRVTVLILTILASLLASPRVAQTTTATTRDLHRIILRILQPHVRPHRLPTVDAACVWLTLARQLITLHPALAAPLLCCSSSSSSSSCSSPLSSSPSSSSWCRELLHRWKREPRVVYNLCALLSPLFLPVPHIRSSTPLVNQTLAASLIHDHALLELLTERLSAYCSATEQHQPLQTCVVEIVRVVRQWSFVPELLALFPSVSTVKKTLVPLLIAQVEQRCREEEEEDELRSAHPRLLLELLLTLQQLHKSPPLAQMIAGSTGLHSAVSQLLVKPQRYTASATVPSATDSELSAVLERELKKTLALLREAPATVLPSASASQRQLQRVSSSSSSSRMLPSSFSSSSFSSPALMATRRAPSSLSTPTSYSSSSSVAATALVRTRTTHSSR